jgi:hypothetical protein
MVLNLWRQDRKESQERYSNLAKESAERASSMAKDLAAGFKESAERAAAIAKEAAERSAAIAMDFRSIVEGNTQALTTLAERLKTPPEGCGVVALLVEALKKGGKVNLEP